MVTDYHHRDTKRTEDSQRTRLFYYPLEIARSLIFSRAIVVSARSSSLGLCASAVKWSLDTGYD
jgi:hypothetical protein